MSKTKIINKRNEKSVKYEHDLLLRINQIVNIYIIQNLFLL